MLQLLVAWVSRSQRADYTRDKVNEVKYIEKIGYVLLSYSASERRKRNIAEEILKRRNFEENREEAEIT